MRYVPSSVFALCGTAAVVAGLWLTREPMCLWALALVGIVSILLSPSSK
jgi:hypothetical protein